MDSETDTAGILLTGATGFIGRHVLRELLQSHRFVTALVRPGHAATAEDRLRALMRSCGWPDAWNRQLTVIEGALPDSAANPESLLGKAMTSCDRVVHCAAEFRSGS